jgi:integrase
LTYLVQRTTERWLGFKMGLHQFRHLGAKTILDEHPGAHESVRQYLGHRNMKTTSNFYAGLDPRRAARLHAEVVRKVISQDTERARAVNQSPFPVEIRSRSSQRKRRQRFD